ncbi:uncharacterized protein LOC126901993 isoform X2 [Daktulosphaira vitifoliae]|nr:uncharacterized protein LOC126901993 isoform X2 [Daktulosphaira vitifoliae]XP_050534968.1 uncharacterized protein LOC126901993 isoform X2 [Daktulosphaira vitifoliae]XP_050534969.1 uncharacterized protein LOC126901993 isoform X2 [Daktulosphaira vitifoliae]XP_050534970.1 uncharacterized protein LOC126901993 isoform X2 [Daktulosphaira vitifoliae]
MNYYGNIHIILLNIIISNAIIVHEINELFTNIENQTFVTKDNLYELIRSYPAFIKLTLRENKYYTGSDASLCPLPYDENTLLDDPDVKKLQYFDPRECKKPWTWTQQNQIIVPVPKNDTTKIKLGELIRHDSNLKVIQKYTYYLNTMESVGITLVDRFCSFVVEVINRFHSFPNKTVVYNLKKVNPVHLRINLNIVCFKKLFVRIYETFKKYFISTLPLDCITNILKVFSPNDELTDIPIPMENIDQYKAKLLECRTLTNLKKNYAILENDELWEHDAISNKKRHYNDIISLHNRTVLEGADLFDSEVMLMKQS